MTTPDDERTLPTHEDLVAAIVREANSLLFLVRRDLLRDVRHVDALMQAAIQVGHHYHDACMVADKARDAALGALQASWDAERGAGLALRELGEASEPGCEADALAYSARRMLASTVYAFERTKVEKAHYEAVRAAGAASGGKYNAALHALNAALAKYMRVVCKIAHLTDDEDMRRFCATTLAGPPFALPNQESSH